MSLHYSSGKLLLKNTTDNLWYFISASLFADTGLVHLKVHQESQGALALVGYDTYAIIRADSGVLYKLSLQTNNSGVIDYQFDIATLPVTQQPGRIWIKDADTGLLYELTGVTSEQDGLVYVHLGGYSATGNTLLDRPFKCQSPVTTTDNRCHSVASFYALAQVVIPPFNGVPFVPPGGEGILGEGGESILGEDGENILAETGTGSGVDILDEGGENSILDENGNPIQGE